MGAEIMRSFISVATSIVLLGVLAVPAFSAPKPKQEKETVESLVAQIIAECKLDEKQQADLKAKAKAVEDAQKAWDTANADKVKAAEEAVEKAKGGDADARKKAASELKDLMAQRTQACATAHNEMFAVLTKEQTALWQGCLLSQVTLKRYQRAKLTDEQIAKVKFACVAAGKVIADNPGDDKADKKARSEIQGKLSWAIETLVLTPDQASMFVRKGKGGAAAPAAPTPAVTPATAPAAPVQQ